MTILIQFAGHEPTTITIPDLEYARVWNDGVMFKLHLGTVYEFEFPSEDVLRFEAFPSGDIVSYEPL